MKKDFMADRKDKYFQTQDDQSRNAAGRASDKTEISNCSGCYYEIRVKGHLDSQWSDWLDGLEFEFLNNGEMILFGSIVDQAALMGVLNKLGRLNLALLSVNEVKRTN
jgi:hypothetical protein